MESIPFSRFCDMSAAPIRMDVLNQFRRYLTQPHVRPWALSSPILVLLICLPLLRPLRHPDPRLISDDEQARLATVQSLVEHRSLAIEQSAALPIRGTFRKNGHVFTDQPPVLSVLLAAPYWIMQRFGLSFHTNPSLVAYLLTMLGATIPVAAAAGMIYRMGRMFELRRPRRAMLAAGVVLGSGLISYGVVLNALAPAAALLLASAGCIVYVAIAKHPRVTSGWLAISGMCAALAATIDPTCTVFAVLIALAILGMRWRLPMRVGGLALYALGAAPPILLHAALMMPITGDVLPPRFHPELTSTNNTSHVAAVDDGDLDDAPPLGTGWWAALGRNLARVSLAFFGEHGIFSHFPVVLFGILGVAAVMHRHWPMTTKALATATLVGAAAVILVYCVITLSGPGTMFGPQAFVVFLPLVMLWSGAWVRRPHHPGTWAIAGALLAFSISVALIGATDPCPRDGYDRYTVAQALSNLVKPEAVQTPAVLAGR